MGSNVFKIPFKSEQLLYKELVQGKQLLPSSVASVCSYYPLSLRSRWSTWLEVGTFYVENCILLESCSINIRRKVVDAKSVQKIIENRYVLKDLPYIRDS